jgi:GNAT superfamily N-acetyltransferase
MIDYRIGTEGLHLDDALAIYRESRLAERRPIEEPGRLRLMLQNANLIVVAWDGLRPVGIARSVTDWTYCTYLSDLAVRDSHQRKGIGRALIRCTQAAAPSATLILLAAPAAVDYYPHIGMEQHPSAWVLRPGEKV